MPKFEYKTNRGTFVIDSNRQLTSQELEQAISQRPQQGRFAGFGQQVLQNLKQAALQTVQPAIGFTQAAGLDYPGKIYEKFAGPGAFKRLETQEPLGRIARGVGTTAGFLFGGPAKALKIGGRLGGGLATRMIPRAIKTARIGKAIEPIARGLGAGAGAFGTLEAVTAPELDITEKLKTVPTAAGLGAALGGLSGLAKGIPRIPVTKARAGEVIQTDLGAVTTKNVKQFLENTMSFTTPESVTQNVIARAFRKGMKVIFTHENRAPNAFLNLGRRIRGNLEMLRSQRGKEVGAVKEALKKNPKRAISIAGIRTQYQGNIGDVLGREIRGDISPVRLVKKQTRSIEDWLIDFNRRLWTAKDRLTAKEAFNIIDDIDDIVSYGKQGKLFVGSREEGILKLLRNQLSTQLKNVKNFGNLASRYTKTAANFEEVANLWDDIGAGLNDNTVTNFLRTATSDKPTSAIILERLNKLNNLLPEKFMEQLKDVGAAQALHPLIFHGIRTGILNVIGGGIIGATIGAPSGPRAAAFGTLAGALAGGTLSTPRGVAALISAGQTGLQTGGQFGRFMSPVAKRIIPPLLLQRQRKQ